MKSDLHKAAEIIARCRTLARITDAPGETARTFLSPAMRRANECAAAWMQQAGLKVWMDAAGNLRGVRASRKPNAATLVLGSHLDTVPDAGAFDGVLGVLLALAVTEALREDLPFSIEVIAFSEEEGVRFGEPFIGSRGLTGTLDDALLARTDHNGISVREAICSYGLDIAQLPNAAVNDPFGYLEFHIEQGPVLDSEGLPLAVVESIAGQSRYELVFTGEANHAGTTPMHLRRDAMAAAAEWIVEVERHASGTPALAATCGAVRTVPGAGNVIAGEVSVSLDVRSPNGRTRSSAVTHLLSAATACGAKRGVAMEATLRMEQPAVPMDTEFLKILEDAVNTTGVPVRRMVSGAGHDAMVLAPRMPAAMLFLRTPRGISHHPDEAVLPADVALALEAGIRFVRALAAKEATA